FESCRRVHPCLHFFPTRRSSDLHGQIVGLKVFGWTRTLLASRALRVAEQTGTGTCRSTSIGPRSMIKKLWAGGATAPVAPSAVLDRKSTRLNSSHVKISYAVFCL